MMPPPDFPIYPLTWSCHICGAIRPDCLISVYSTDLSKEYDFPPDTFRQNVRYCNDNPDCAKKAITFRFHSFAPITVRELSRERCRLEINDPNSDFPTSI